MSEPGEWHVYLLRCAESSLYCGIAKDVESRVMAHNAGRGAKYTRSRQPCQLVYCESGHTHSSALRRERQIKRLSRVDKEALLENMEKSTWGS
jgi:predicted GIY-YIG superfamily endonuclease